MGGETDTAKGRVKESVGALTGNDDMKREGKVDQASGDIKDKADKLGDKLSDAGDAIGDKLKGR